MRFPRGRAEFPDEVVAHIAGQMKLPAGEFDSYQWTGSTIEYHCAQIREHLGFRGVLDTGRREADGLAGGEHRARGAQAGAGP
ncbi:DUF4158 domain-containing protein [Streptomyces sp. NBC_00841]|uniref:DUF4158 domain-containing protein n=1 Tax=Streptomyces sp. NBC_00841 TaxID=2975847 RepID=UPI003FA3BDF9